MEYGTSFNGEWLEDFGALREAAIALEEAGLDFVTYGGHVLTSPAGRYDRPPSTYSVVFRDFFVLFATLAATTTTLRFRSSVLILPMFPTVHVAKQAADLSLISGGRFELGVGVSRDEPEYRAMGQDLSVRGRRLEEQLIVLKRLWTEPFVTFHGRFHEIEDMGIGQLPTSPIPIWIGCGDGARSLSRVGRLAEGWMPLGSPAKEKVEELNAAAMAAGRSGTVGVTARVNVHPDDPDATLAEARVLLGVGVNSISITPPPGSDIASGIDAVINVRRELAAALGS